MVISLPRSRDISPVLLDLGRVGLLPGLTDSLLRRDYALQVAPVSETWPPPLPHILAYILTILCSYIQIYLHTWVLRLKPLGIVTQIL